MGKDPKTGFLTCQFLQDTKINGFTGVFDDVVEVDGGGDGQTFGHANKRGNADAPGDPDLGIRIIGGNKPAKRTFNQSLTPDGNIPEPVCIVT